MTPKQAYDDVSRRARLLLSLHDGLIDTRKRGIREDWRREFCRFMRWNLNARIKRVDSKDALIILRHEAGLTRDDFSSESLTDLLRSSLATAVSAVDRYVHERVVRGVVKALKRSKLSGNQREFAIPAYIAVRMATTLARARNAKQKKKPAQVRPANEIRKAVQDLLHKRSFQSWAEIQGAFGLIGNQKVHEKMKSAYRPNNLNTVQSELAKIVERRNHIVHEGDLIRHKRGGRVKRRPLRRKFVEESIAFLDQFVGRLEQIS